MALPFNFVREVKRPPGYAQGTSTPLVCVHARRTHRFESIASLRLIRNVRYMKMKYIVCSTITLNCISIIFVATFMLLEIPADGFIDIPAFLISWWSLLGMPVSTVLIWGYLWKNRNRFNSIFIKSGFIFASIPIAIGLILVTRLIRLAILG